MADGKLYPVMHAVVPPLAKVIWRPTVEGLRNLPDTGPVIVASNHLSFADSLVIPIVTTRKVTFLAKAQYFNGTGFKGAVSRGFFGGLGMIPVDREDSRAALASLDIALDILAKGGAFGIYPEGTRSRDGRLYRGRTGVAHLALTSGAPVVPVGLAGTQHIQPVGSTLPRLAKVTVKFGEPLQFQQQYDGVPVGRARREVTDQVMNAIQKLSGQQFAGVYNDHAGDAV